ncbi:uncharacterized protein LOC133001691 [Limanda limanda]|uniref:uncharacterized protein LOC133001691 n=1 Tax=Limanda limanda TaxID=27771 RepID=UPI0029C84C6D|nr:uncharacterized protein LOC133001691 [Limanda limanda]XP_060927318.1 uncharacterized protein LOC133001691 [Limanda limanda]
MMDNPAATKSHVPCLSWVSPHGWSSSSTGQGALLEPLGGSQHLGLGSSSDHRPSYDHLLGPSCVSGPSSLQSPQSPHNMYQSAMYKPPHVSSHPAAAALFTDTSIQNHGGQLCRSQHVPLLLPHNPYRPQLTNQGLAGGLQGLPMSLPACGQRLHVPQAPSGGMNVESAGVAGYAQGFGPSTSQEQAQWMPSLHSRGAENKSGCDAAAQCNNEPSHKNRIPLPDNERQRSAILNQRAQLLKQLAEMDELLDSIPADDTGDGRSLHTAMQSHLSAHCSSPASCDEHVETCDLPGDPMSAGESLKKENTSSESGEDTDPDYFPNDDGDFSDVQSDTDWSSSDKSSHSASSTPDEEPSEGKTKTKSSLFKDKGAKKFSATNQKKSSQTVVLPTLNTKEQRVYDKRNYCLFCSKPQSKMARHFERVHCDKAEVAVAFQYPVLSRERRKIWKKLINQGNFVHNKNVIKAGKGVLAVQKRPRKPGQAQDFLHCLYCHGLYVKKAVYRHMRKCPDKVKDENESEFGRKRIASRCALEIFGDLGISDGFKDIVCEMIYDDVTKTVIDDQVILQFGEQMFNQYASDVRKHDYIRQNLRQLARLVLEAQKTTPLKNLEEFFYPSSFRHVVAAVKVLAGYDLENKTFSIPSLAIKLGYHLQKACSIVEANAVKSGDTSLAESAKNFLVVYQKKWNRLISSGALTNLREIKKTTDRNVPIAQDVRLLNSHLDTVHRLAENKLGENPSAENYACLAKVILARTIVFNRRKPGEVSSIQLKTFMSRKKSNVLDDMDVSVTDLERTMCGIFSRVDIKGSCGRMVPVLLKPSFVSAMELLVKLRETCGVPQKNPFLFGRPCALSAYKGSESIHHFVKECGAKNPEALTSRKILKHYPKMLQLMNLDDEEAKLIFGRRYQTKSYQQNGCMQQDDMDFEERLYPETGQQAASWYHTELSGTSYQQADDYQQEHGSTTGNCRTVPTQQRDKGSQYKGKQKWEEAEVRAVERHMMRFIEGHKVPQKNDCIQCLEAEAKALKTRSWKGVKDYVRNRITALKRQSGPSQA